ncbi:CMRF35-like molecule 9 isoform X1 [Antechinus flavipes]|uniref:CMRF35-like molecule 9 isoform X1 n=2 Tax=Antechinus flavipes TaxID=38775 RepID=UPI002235864F|nr:CMRF35-like molecule 9 isoform X1 [Antechinus flavipes]
MRFLLLWGWIIVPGYGAMVGPKEVSGPEGSSLSVQCSYEDKHRERKKYWCKDNGLIFNLCAIVISTEAGKEETNGEMSIKDDPQNGTFTVIMRKVTQKDAGKYQCGISIFGPDETFEVTVIVFSGLESSDSLNPSLQPPSTRSDQQGVKVWETRSPELRIGSYVSPKPSLQPLFTRRVQQGAKVRPGVITPTQEKIKPSTFTNVGTRAAVLRRGQETLQTRTQEDVVQTVTSHYSPRDMNPRSRISIPLIRILAPCIILLLLLVVAIATLLILLARRKKAQLVVESGKNGQFHYSNSVKESQD